MPNRSGDWLRQAERDLEQAEESRRSERVPADVLAYTLGEWEALPEHRPRFARVLRDETVWIAGSPPGGDGRS